jgi:hypothetical protein
LPFAVVIYNRQRYADSPMAGLGFLLFIVLLVVGPIAISRSPLKIKAALHILAGVAVGLAAGFALGALLRNAELAGDLGFALMFCGGIWVSVRKIRRVASPRTGSSQ